MQSDLLVEKLGRCLRFGHAARFHLVIERLHRGLGQRSLQPTHGGQHFRIARCRVEPVEPDGVIAGKERLVILEQHQIAAANHGIGRVNIDDVDFAGQQLAIGDVMVDADDIALLADRNAVSAPASRRRGRGIRASARAAVLAVA